MYIKLKPDKNGNINLLSFNPVSSCATRNDIKYYLKALCVSYSGRYIAYLQTGGVNCCKIRKAEQNT